MLPEYLKDIRWRGVLSVFGCFLVHLTLGSFYSFGNMMTYMVSYMRKHGLPDLTYGEFIIVQSAWGLTQGFVTPFSGFIVRAIGLKKAIFIGCTIFSIGTATTYFTLDSGNLTLVALTYGVTQAFGEVIALIPPMTIAMSWFPEKKALATGIVVGGFGGGSFIWNQVQTRLINPNNIGVVDEYFVDEEMLNRVPSLMLILAAVYFSIQVLCMFLIKVPESLEAPTEEEEEEKETFKSFLVNVLKTALSRKEFYLLWACRFCMQLITQCVSGFYKAYGLTIEVSPAPCYLNDKLVSLTSPCKIDDHFLSTVGAFSSLFNCASRILFGFVMDKTSYKTTVIIETVLLSIFIASLPATASGGKIMFAVWIWAIYLLFPAIFALQPAVTTQTFGYKYGGTIYGLLFTCDLVLNPIVGAASQPLLDATGWSGYFFSLASFGAVAVLVNLFYPRNPGGEEILERNSGDLLDVSNGAAKTSKTS